MHGIYFHKDIMADTTQEAYLPAAPNALIDACGQVHTGKFAGTMPAFDWSALASPLRRSAVWRRFHHKHWQYAALVTEQIFCGIAIVDLGWTNTAFAYVFDRQKRKMLTDFSQDGIPGLTAHLNDHPAVGAESWFRFRGQRLHFLHQPANNTYLIDASFRDCQIRAELHIAGAAPELLAIGSIVGGGAHATMKSAGMRLSGEVRVGQRCFSLIDGCGSGDHSNGFPARETRWLWASAHTPEIGFNLQSGYFGDQENALWLDGRLISLSSAQFEYDPANVMAPWHIRTTDGLLDLHFQPEGVRSENKNLLIAASRYQQPVGVFSGWVKAHADASLRPVTSLAGVTEDHFARW